MNINQIHEEIVEYEAMREDEEWGAYLDHCVWSDPLDLGWSVEQYEELEMLLNAKGSIYMDPHYAALGYPMLPYAEPKPY